MESSAESMELSGGSGGQPAPHHVAVNFLPSRQLPHTTLRLRRVHSERSALLLEAAADAPDAADARADCIVRELEQHRLLMSDDPVSEELRREALRDLPQGLTMKRTVRAKLSASVSLRSRRRPISLVKRLKYRLSFVWKRSGDRLRDLVFSVEPWYEAIRHVEGQLGSAVGSYFRLLRWLLGLDLLLAALLLGFVVAPQALHERAAPGDRTARPSARDFVTGKGALEHSLLFYGAYHDAEVSHAGAVRYDMPFAYFYTMLCVYLMFFAVLCYRTAESYRRNFIEPSGGGGLGPALAAKLFCGWDFGIASPRGAARAARALCQEFKESLLEQNRPKPRMSRWARWARRGANALAWALVLGGVAAALGALWRLLGARLAEEYTSLAVTAAAAACPALLGLVVRLEYYSARTAFYVTLARTWLLDIGTLLLLLLYWARSGTQCWETRVGQEGYRLVVLDALVALVLLPGAELARALLYRWKVVESPAAFDITYSSLTLIYNQSVLWLAMVFSPPLVVAVALKLLLLFYVKREVALRTAHAGKKVWRAAQTQTVLLMLVTLSLFLALLALGSLFLRSPSLRCGPFRRYPRVLDVLSEGLLRLSERPGLRAALRFCARPGALAFALLGLCVCVHAARARAAAQRAAAATLRRVLRLQARDKEFLLAAIDKVSNGEWRYSARAPPAGSHTWRYARDVRRPANAACRFDARAHEHAPDGDSDSSFSWRPDAPRSAR